MVYEFPSFDANGWNFAVWGGFYRAVFYFYCHLGKRILLSFWIFVPRFCHFGRRMLADIDCYDLFPGKHNNDCLGFENIRLKRFEKIEGLNIFGLNTFKVN